MQIPIGAHTLLTTTAPVPGSATEMRSRSCSPRLARDAEAGTTASRRAMKMSDAGGLVLDGTAGPSWGASFIPGPPSDPDAGRSRQIRI